MVIHTIKDILLMYYLLLIMYAMFVKTTYDKKNRHITSITSYTVSIVICITLIRAIVFNNSSKTRPHLILIPSYVQATQHDTWNLAQEQLRVRLLTARNL